MCMRNVYVYVHAYVYVRVCIYDICVLVSYTYIFPM